MRTTLTLILIFSLFCGTLTPFVASAQNLNQEAKTQEKQKKGLKFSLSEAKKTTETVEKPERNRVVEGTDLSDAEVEAIFKRLSAVRKAQEEEFSQRSETLPPPKAGKVIPVNFSPTNSEAPSANKDVKLEVIRYSPQGSVSIAPEISVTFSQPMVAVTSQEEASENVPVEVSPALPEGKWRWLGTKTIIFDAKSRLPMATKFTARIPAGTRSANGQQLEKDFVWTFSTSAPKIISSYPKDEVTMRDVPIFVGFDQKIKPEEMVKSIIVTAGQRRISVRLATEDEIQSDEKIKEYVKEAQPQSWLVLRAVDAGGATKDALPSDSEIKVTVMRRAPSAEGPLTTTEEQSFKFKTFGKLEFTKIECEKDYIVSKGYKEEELCDPTNGWRLFFSNQIDTKSFSASMVRVEPPIENMEVYPSGNQIVIEGTKKSKTEYRVFVSESLKDVFGQNLSKPVNVTRYIVPSQPSLYGLPEELIVADPLKKPAISLYSVNVPAIDVYFYQVRPEDWASFCEVLENRGAKLKPVGNLIRKQRINVKNVQDKIVETKIDVPSILGQTYGQFFILVEPVIPVRRGSKLFAWYQMTQIGIETVMDEEDMIVYVSDLKTGKPLSGVEVTIYPDNPSAKRPFENSVFSWLNGWLWGETESSSSRKNITGQSGVLRFPLSEEQPRIIVAKRGNDIAVLPERTVSYGCYRGNSSEGKRSEEQFHWYIFDDRRTYRPGEEVSVKGYIRLEKRGKLFNLLPIEGRVQQISYVVTDSRGNEFAEGTAQVNLFGAFDFRFNIPKSANLGWAKIKINALGVEGNTKKNRDDDAEENDEDDDVEEEDKQTEHSFMIQEFRRPEFEVKTNVLTESPHILKKDISVAVEAKYYAGGALPEADVEWVVRSRPTNYSPPRHSDYSFGIWTPWWMKDESEVELSRTEELSGKTDSAGKHILKITTESADPVRPYELEVSAGVQDVNRQTWSSSVNLLVHPSTLYVGLKTDKYFIQKGESLKVDSIVSDIDGNLVSGRDVQVVAELLEWRFVESEDEWREVKVDEQRCNYKSTDKPARCNFTPKQGGRLRIKARVLDDAERPNESEITIWVAGGRVPSDAMLGLKIEEEEVRLIPSKEEFSVGDVAEILVISPFPDAEGIVTLSQNGIFRVERISVEGSSTVLKIPIEEAYLPNFTVNVNLNGMTEEDKEKRPAYAAGKIKLKVSLKPRTLKVSANALDKTLSPGGATKIDLEVKDSANKPVADAEVAVVAVDEAILALTNYRIESPLEAFYSRASSSPARENLRQYVLLQKPGAIGEGYGSGIGNGVLTSVTGEVGVVAVRGYDLLKYSSDKSDRRNDSEASIKLRSNFSPLALFLPSVRTDSNGKASVDLKLPDNLTRYRITAVAVDKSAKLYGLAEDAATARKNLMLRPSPPRFLNFGDKILFPVVVQNQSDNPVTVDLVIRSSNAQIQGSKGKRIVVPANDRVEVRFPVSTVKSGESYFQVAAVSESLADAVEVTVPVFTPATTESFATYFSIDDNSVVAQPVKVPKNVFAQFGGLEITTSSTQLQELTDAFIYLCRYPYESSESIASRIISIAALYDVLKSFKVEGLPSDEEIKERIEQDIKTLSERQRYDGSFGLWSSREERFNYPFLTAHVTHALLLAKARGYKVSSEVLEEANQYLKEIEEHFDQWHKKNAKLGATVSAYALYVRSVAGDVDKQKAKQILSQLKLEEHSFEALGWLMSVLSEGKKEIEVETIKRYLINRVAETAKTAHFVTQYEDGQWLVMHSNRRADGVLLEALLKADAQNDLIPKIVRGLLEQRKKGRWDGTQENVFILLALKKYFDVYEKATPEFVAKIWLGDGYMGSQEFRGRSVDSRLLRIPMRYLLDGKEEQDLIVQKEGQGRLYYRVGMKYALKEMKQEAADYGFTVIRKYEAVDSADDVKRAEDGTWLIKAGAQVRVRLTMVAPARRYHVALVDQLPAGFEILNPELAVTEKLPEDEEEVFVEYGSRSYEIGWIWWRRWYEHENLRDDRAEIFASLVWGGVYEYVYYVRATTPGEFIAPASHVEEMYSPETFGLSASDRVKIVD